MKKMLFIAVVLVHTLFFSQPGLAQERHVVHVLVALCDNVHQGIVPVPRKLGDGDDPAGNLYWGAAYGVKTFMRKQPGWELIHTEKSPLPEVLERIVLRHTALKVDIVADAYRGKDIEKCTADFLHYAAGRGKVTVDAGAKLVAAGADAHLVVYVGHNGLMDFALPALPTSVDERNRQVAIFACQSKFYFSKALQAAGAKPLLWTRGNMAPEAYTLHALVTSWAQGKNDETVREAVAQAYHKYQKCGIKGARGLFATGW